MWNMPISLCKAIRLQACLPPVCAHLTADQPHFSLLSQPPIQQAFLELRLGSGTVARDPLSYLTSCASWHRCRIELVSPPFECIIPRPEMLASIHLGLLKPSVKLLRHS